MAEGDAERIRSLGWRQGSILPSTISDRLVAEGVLSSTGTDQSGVFIVVSHDCDVVALDFDKEPFVEVILARELGLEGVDGSCTYGKNPRQLDFELTPEADPIPFSMSAHDRWRIDRRILAIEGPDPRILPRPLLRVIRLWLAKRYTREAFPDALNDRIRPMEQKVRSVLRKEGRYISGIYLGVSDDELPEGETYKALLVATMEVESYADADRRVAAQSAVDGCEALLGQCDGIEIGDSRLVSEAEFSIDSFNYLKRWDWDDLSYRHDPPDSHPPEAV